MSVEHKHVHFTFFEMHAGLQLYKSFRRFLPFFLRAITIINFAFFSKQGANEAKVTFVRRKPPLETLENMTLLDCIKLKTQNTSAFIDEQTVLHCRCYYFHTRQKVDGEGFFSQISTFRN